MKIISNPDVDVLGQVEFPDTGAKQKTCFVIMPFKAKTKEERRLQSTYKNCIQPFIEKEMGMICTRADDPRYFRNGKILVTQIWQAICRADVIIADFTYNNPNVTYEAGLARSLGKPVICITQVIEDSPFDIKHLRLAEYDDLDDGLDKLKIFLEGEIYSALKEESFPQRCEDSEEVKALRAEILELRSKYRSLEKQWRNQNNDLNQKEATIEKLNQEIEELKKQPLAVPASTFTPTSNNIRVGQTIHVGKWEWLVLNIQDGEALIITKDIIERKVYDETLEATTWAECTLRTYLNGEFLAGNFSSEEQNKISKKELKNEDNPKYITNGGKNTGDKIFLLSIKEVSIYFKSNKERIAKYQNKTSPWWLRSPGNHPYHAAYVVADGNVDVGGYNVLITSLGVRPVLYLNLKS
ncbi:MAG: DUF6273 domain-containing protein [Oscillospiraceae bacterium]|jgi:predicted transcriptional regulator|nr:DUF6273 domain-containing protein [Oscillospiraceae bacterium]